ncbi:transcriptional regulator [Halothiobacillus diazotrophicus]|uniref:Transcriptional regulator n=1 Tax=Halothiobacillus diazotrophicus TaxID=1860122 RepID=A0A191ZEI3_9GAMM|nr:SIR2 family protein [Halothiobacillus diazotrophicus]ANJ66270.1 transcriptional regulator [Halothiobacillus diazotrophicus]
MNDPITEVRSALAAGRVIPYIGPGVLAAAGADLPSNLPTLAEILSSRVSVPHKIRKNFTAVAQYIENFKHRKSLKAVLNDLFSVATPVPELMKTLAGMDLPMIVNLWYDNTLAQALKDQASWGRIQGFSQSEHYGQWYGFYQPDGTATDAATAESWTTVLYEPWGSIVPDQNYLASDADFVEVLTEIDIQTPIPQIVQDRRKDRGFLFLGCRFDDQLQRTFARQIMKRSSNRHWAVIEGELTKKEARFLEEQGIERLDISLAEVLNGALTDEAVPA